MGKITGILAMVGIVVVFGVGILGYAIGTKNQEVKLRNTIEAQVDNIESYYDKMWKILQQKAGVTSEYRESFNEIYVNLMEGRYSQGDGTLMKWIQESNPQFDASLYKDLMTSIEIERTGFHNEQTKVLDLIREHKNLTNLIPQKFFLDVEPIIYVVISSTKSKEVMESRVDDNVSLF